MSTLLNYIKQKKIIIIIAAILLICSIAIAIGVYSQITNKGYNNKEQEKETINYEELKANFQEIFNNSINKQETAHSEINYEELLYTRFNIQEEESGKYLINAKVPWFKGESETLSKINDEILHVFGAEIIKVKNTATSYTTYNLDYVAYVNNNIISLVIMCKYKNGTNAQRRIIQCYNYDIENDKLLNIDDIIAYKNLSKEEIQKKINDEIKKVNNQMESISEQGYNVFLRDENANIYNIENTPNYFLGENNYLYLVYAYGNNNYTSEMDLVIFY